MDTPCRVVRLASVEGRAFSLGLFKLNRTGPSVPLSSGGQVRRLLGLWGSMSPQTNLHTLPWATTQSSSIRLTLSNYENNFIIMVVFIFWPIRTSFPCALLCAGCVVEMTEQVVTGKVLVVTLCCLLFRTQTCISLETGRVWVLDYCLQ